VIRPTAELPQRLQEWYVSGQVTRFHSLEELLAFMVSVLADVQEQPGEQ
jgi:hypothetical protein